MEDSLVKFTGSTKTVGGYLTYSCLVEYPSNIDPFLPDDLKKQTDCDGIKTTVLPFQGGRGSFSSSSIEPALRVEAEIKDKLQTAYQALLRQQELVERWTGAREYGLEHISSEGNHERSLASILAHDGSGSSSVNVDNGATDNGGGGLFPNEENEGTSNC